MKKGEKLPTGKQLKTEQKVVDVYSLIARGAKEVEIVEFCKKTYNINRRRAFVLIKLAKEKMREILNKKMDEIRSEAIAKYEELYRLAMKDKDYKTATYIQSRIDKLNGIEFVGQQNDINVNTIIQKIQNVFNNEKNG